MTTGDKLTVIGGVFAIAAAIGGAWLSLHDSVQRHDIQIEMIGETVKESREELKAFRAEWKSAVPVKE